MNMANEQRNKGVLIVEYNWITAGKFIILTDNMKKILLLIIICLFTIESNGQDNKSNHKKVYNLNYKFDIPLTAGMFALNIYGVIRLGDKPPLSVDQITSLDKNDIWTFDRVAVNQSYSDPSQAHTISDIGLWTTYVLPALLFIDKDIRQNWLDITILYLETQAINLNVYLYGGPVFTRRIRPYVYYEEASMDWKLKTEATDSWFSGHVSMTAGATFFMAKVLSDYHPELGGKKWLLYAGALIPPAFVGYYRYKGYMHFPTDLLVGTAIGAAVGVLTPQLHKITKNNTNLSIVPFAGNYTGVAVSLKF